MAYLILVILHMKFQLIQLTVHLTLIIIAPGLIVLIVIIIRFPPHLDFGRFKFMRMINTNYICHSFWSL